MKIGFLPLYIALYDKTGPHQRVRHNAFCEDLMKKFETHGLEVVASEICTLKPQFEKAVADFEAAGVDAIVTVHLAYSPSGEYYEVLSKTKLPIIVLDTTSTNDFSDQQSRREISYCHGIHGVMDMCCMLKKNEKAFAICAGHVDNEEMWTKLVGYVKAASSAKAFYNSTVGTIGGKFDGMEDFAVSEDLLKSRFGIDVVKSDKAELIKIASEVTEAEIAAEVEKESKLGKDIAKSADPEKVSKKLQEISDEDFKVSAKTNIVLRKWIEAKKLDALTVNFLGVTDAGLDTMPFMGACFAMQDGIGYAGEGDTFTASLVGALLKNYEETSFIEIFCPDWKNDTLFISHMGEMNYRVAGKELELFRNGFVFGSGTPTVVGYTSFKEGQAVYMNLFPTKDDFKMVLAPVEVLKETTDNFACSMRGWIKPTIPVTDFLEKISEEGVTHHSAMVYGATVEELKFFAECLNIPTVVIE